MALPGTWVGTVSRLQGGQRVLLRVAGEGEDLAVILNDGAVAQRVGQHVAPRAAASCR